jgi:hypothetical protein
MTTIGRALRADLAERLAPSVPGTESADDLWEEAAAPRLADEIAAAVTRAREGGIDDETIFTQLQEVADALREGLT